MYSSAMLAGRSSRTAAGRAACPRPGRTGIGAMPGGTGIGVMPGWPLGRVTATQLVGGAAGRAATGVAAATPAPTPTGALAGSPPEPLAGPPPDPSGAP